MTASPFDDQRQQMLHDQLRRRGIDDQAVLAAMGRVPRERFVPARLGPQAYADRALPIDCDQTISQPYIVALMSQALECSGRETVLEIGTGSGYQTAILAEVAREVISIERHPALSKQAAAVLADLGYENVTLVVGDGSLGWPGRAPYDRIIVTAAAAQCPNTLFEQLKEGGIVAIPVGGHDCQTLQAIRKEQGKPRRSNLSSCRFVPLLGAQGWPD
jgi:protein-L-isoaspartate(D-aspartate) O-methyltransferase